MRLRCTGTALGQALQDAQSEGVQVAARDKIETHIFSCFLYYSDTYEITLYPLCLSTIQ